MPKINKYINNVKREFTTYQSIDAIRLHASERDLPFDHNIWEYFLSKLNDSMVRYYPNNNHALHLLELFTNIDKIHLTLTDGSDRALRNIFQVFSNPGTDVITTEPSFPMYKVYTDMYGLHYKPQAYSNIEFPYDAIYSQISDNTSIVILSNPSSPVGNVISYEMLSNLLNKCTTHDALLVIDEAYIEFSNAISMKNIAKNNNNIIVINTTSKAFGSAGTRIGYSISSAYNTNLLYKVKNMNDVTAFSIAWLETLLHFKNESNEYIDAVIDNRTKIISLCNKYNIDIIPSETNFLHIAGVIANNDFITKTCKFSWSDTEYTRFSIPADKQNFNLLIKNIQNYCKTSN